MSPCPICSKLAVEQFRPFCSKRCADVDLSRWLKGSYAIPGENAADLDQPDSAPRKRQGDYPDDAES